MIENINNQIIVKKSLIKRWWFWVLLVLLVIVVLVIVGVFSGKSQKVVVINKPKQAVSFGGRWQDPRLLQLSSSTPTWGNPKAKIVVVEFADFQCQFCLEEFPIIRSIMKQYEKEMFFIWRQFPIASAHPEAQLAAEASVCAQEQGKFWPFHDQLFLHQNDLGQESLYRYADQVGLEKASFASCLQSHKYQAKVEADLQLGLQNGVKGTPTFFVNGLSSSGAIPESSWQKLMQAVIVQ